MVENNRKNFFKGLSVQSIVTITMGVLEIVVFALMSRLLTKNEFGYYAALTGVLTISTCITEAGLGAAIIQKKDADNSYISTAFTMSWILGLCGTMVIFVFAPVIAELVSDSNMTLPLRIMSVNVFLACISSVRRCFLIKELRFKQVGLYNVVSYSISSLVGIIMALKGFGLYSVVSIPIVNLILFNMLLYFPKGSLPKFKITPSQVKEIFSFGGWLTASVIVNNITQHLDRLCLSRWISVVALGSYNRPAGFVANITTKINGIFDTVLFPTLSKMQDDADAVRRVFVQAVKLLNSFSVILFAIFFFNAELIVKIFFGSEWESLVPVLRIVSIYVIFNIDGRLVDCYFRSLNLVKLGFELRVFVSLMTLLLLYVGSKFDIIGVAVSLVLANVITVFIKVFFLCKRIGTSFLSIFCAVFVAYRSILPLLPLCLLNLFYFNHGTYQQVIFATIMGLAIFVELVFFPKLVGKEYCNVMYPLIRKVLKRN